ncbi:MAG: hypothetical protein JF616_20370 [Fibrobacteres bacterium]|nr:hypothetical protein [Fibrobacterota bacterium]
MNWSRLTICSALATVSLGALSAEAKVLSHFNGNGAFADAYFQGDGGGKDYSSINVTQGGTHQAPATDLNYYAAFCDTASTICSGISGNGQIPNKDFSASGKSASLSTNTASNQNFYAVKWTYNYATQEYSESQINLGVIAVNWKSSGLSSFRSTGTSTSTYLNTTWKSTGQSSYTDAAASGTVGGTPLNAAGGSIGTNSNNDIVIERN